MKKALRIIRSEPARIAAGGVLLALAVLFGHFELGRTLPLYIAALLVAGWGVFLDAARGILRRDFLDEKFLMSIASVCAMIIGEYTEGVAVMLFFLVGEYFEHKAVAKSRRSIKALMQIRPDEATVLTEDGEAVVDAEDVEVGAVIIVRPGERVPLDCVILGGSSDVDTSAMTGEAAPRSVAPGDTLESGVVVLDGVLECRTLRIASESAASRVLALVENASERKSKEESFITRFSRFYTPFVVLAAVLVAVLLPLFKITSWQDGVYRALMFLVISCPCALVISVPMAFFGGIGRAAASGILFKGGNVFSAVAKADSFAFDKTGTLTTGVFAVCDVKTNGVSREELLYLAASAEYGSNHPIALSLKNASERKKRPENTEELAGKGVIATVDGSLIAVGGAALMRHLGISSEGEAGELFVVRDGALIGSVTVSDTVKPEAVASVSALSSLGVKRTVMLSGDRQDRAEAVGREVGIDEVRAELLPDEKYAALEEIISSSKGAVYVGDGINDAPALALADVGVAMGALGQDSAIEAADAVIMSDDLRRLPEMVKIARKTLRIAKENIVFAISVKAAIMLLSVLGYSNMWLAVIADVGVAVLAILNSMRTLLKRK